MKKIIIMVVVLGLAFVLFSRDKQEEDYTVDSDSYPVASIGEKSVAVDDNATVVIRGHKLSEGTLTIEVGTTVMWENTDNLAGLPYDTHTITSGVVDDTGVEGVQGLVPNSGSGVSDGLYEQGLALDETFSYTFTEVGTFMFYIAEHPLVSGERKIIVTEKEEVTMDSSTEMSTMAMISKGFSFSPDTLATQVGELVSLDITAQGDHTFTIDELDVNFATLNGETTRVEFTPQKAGTFEYYCAIPGHKEGGQVGTIVVQE